MRYCFAVLFAFGEVMNSVMMCFAQFKVAGRQIGVYWCGASSSTADAVPLPLPWGRLWFNGVKPLDEPTKVFHGNKICVGFRFAKALPKAGSEAARGS